MCLAPVDSAELIQNGSRGLVFGDEKWPEPLAESGASLDQSPGFEVILGLKTPQVIFAGEHFRIGLWSEHPGFLWLFNLGVLGSSARMVPNERPSPLLKPQSLMWVTEERGLVRDFESAERFKETGPSENADEYPERLLAVLSKDCDANLTSSDLNPDWEPKWRGVWGKVNSAATPFWGWDIGDFEWGLLEVPVGGEDRS